MIRILHVIGSMNQGGAENFIMNLYRNIDRNVIQFDFLVNREGVFDSEIKRMGGNIFITPAIQTIGYRKYTKNLRSFFKDNKYRIVHSHLNFVSGLILECAKKENVPIKIAHSHNSNFHANPFVIAYKRYLGTKFNKNTDVFLACSKNSAKFMFGKNSKKTIIIKNGVDFKRFKYSEKSRQAIRNKYKINKEALVVGNISRFYPQKNHKFIIDIFEEYHKINNNSYLFLIGDGILKEEIIDKINSKNLDSNVKIVDSTFETEKYYSAFDYFLLPSLFEGLPVVLIEAQSSGLQCATSEKVVTKEASITDRVRFVSLDKTAKEWAKNIIKSKDRESFTIDQSFNIKNIADKMQQLYLNEAKRHDNCR